MLRRVALGSAVVLLDEIQKRDVETVEHGTQPAKIWREVKRICVQCARGLHYCIMYVIQQ